MIKIKLIQVDDFLTPERKLTSEEKLTITSTLFNGINVIYYQGDEPIVEQIKEII